MLHKAPTMKSALLEAIFLLDENRTFYKLLKGKHQFGCHLFSLSPVGWGERAKNLLTMGEQKGSLVITCASHCLHRMCRRISSRFRPDSMVFLWVFQPSSNSTSNSLHLAMRLFMDRTVAAKRRRLSVLCFCYALHNMQGRVAVGPFQLFLCHLGALFLVSTFTFSAHLLP